MRFGLVQWQSNIKNAWIPVFTGMTGERRELRMAPWAAYGYENGYFHGKGGGAAEWIPAPRSGSGTSLMGKTGERRDGFPLSDRGRGSGIAHGPLGRVWI